MLMSGLQNLSTPIPRCIGEKRSISIIHLVWMHAERQPDGSLKGVTLIGTHEFTTTGVLGASSVDGQRVERGFPSWITLPGPQWLAMGRLWHFFFAWLFVINGVAIRGLCHLERAFPAGVAADREGHQAHPAGDPRSRAAAFCQRRRGKTYYNALQKPTAGNFRSLDRPCRAHGSHDVANDGRGFSHSAVDVRRPAGRADHSFSLRVLVSCFLRRSHRDGRVVGHLEQHPLHDHWRIRNRPSGWRPCLRAIAATFSRVPLPVPEYCL